MAAMPMPTQPHDHMTTPTHPHTHTPHAPPHRTTTWWPRASSAATRPSRACGAPPRSRRSWRRRTTRGARRPPSSAPSRGLPSMGSPKGWPPEGGREAALLLEGGREGTRQEGPVAGVRGGQVVRWCSSTAAPSEALSPFQRGGAGRMWKGGRHAQCCFQGTTQRAWQGEGKDGPAHPKHAEVQ